MFDAGFGCDGWRSPSGRRYAHSVGFASLFYREGIMKLGRTNREISIVLSQVDDHVSME